jgi:hypothetical protein
MAEASIFWDITLSLGECFSTFRINLFPWSSRLSTWSNLPLNACSWRWRHSDRNVGIIHPNTRCHISKHLNLPHVHYFMRKPAPLFAQTVSRDSSKCSPRCNSNLPWVGVHAFQFNNIAVYIRFLFVTISRRRCFLSAHEIAFIVYYKGSESQASSSEMTRTGCQIK